MASFPAGDPSAIRQDADSLTTLSADTEELSAELRSAIRGVTSSWSGKAADGFERHASPRVPALGQLSDDLRSAGFSARAYGDRLNRAQQNYEAAISFGHSRGLRMATQTLVDPSSLLPPEPAKAVAAVEVERQIAEAVIAAQVAAVEFEGDLVKLLTHADDLALLFLRMLRVNRLGGGMESGKSEPGGKAPNEDDEGSNGSEIVNAQGGPKNVDGDLGVRDGLGGRVFRTRAGAARSQPEWTDSAKAAESFFRGAPQNARNFRVQRLPEGQLRFSYTTETDGNEVETVITINEYDGSVVSKEVIPLRAADGSSATP